MQVCTAQRANSTMALSLRTPGNPDAQGRQFMRYVSFSSNDLSNWKLQNPSFSERASALMGLLDLIMLTHLPTWNDCQQLLQVLFTTKEREDPGSRPEMEQMGCPVKSRVLLMQPFL